jgi:hypothetical protein
MKKQASGMSVLVAIGVLAAAGITSWGHAQTPTINVHWGVPTTGTPVEHYVGEVQSWPAGMSNPDMVTFEFTSPDTTASFTYAYGYSTRCRVAGVDSLDRQGGWSLWSDIWTDHGVPGAPSVPLLSLELVE